MVELPCLENNEFDCNQCRYEVYCHSNEEVSIKVEAHSPNSELSTDFSGEFDSSDIYDSSLDDKLDEYDNYILAGDQDDILEYHKNEQKLFKASQEKEDTYFTAIIKEIKNRKIENLVHFTRLTNLDSIIKNGIVSVKSCENRRIKYTANDNDRLDNCRDAVSISVSYPNYKYLYKLRSKNRTEKWIVLLLSPDVLIDYPAAFFPHNAASAIYKEKLNLGYWNYEHTFEESLNHFQAMFEDDNGNKYRVDHKIPDYYTTDPQAEIMVYGFIEKRYIKGIVFDDVNLVESLKKNNAYDIPVIYNPSYFSYNEGVRIWGY